MTNFSHFGRYTRRAALIRAACASIVACSLAATPATLIAQAPTPQRFQTFNVVPITVTGVNITPAGTLEVVGVIGSHTFTTPMTMTAEENEAGGCPILNLQLQAIHLDLLGLNVDTSDICLDVTAHPGQGLLGDLLCAVANLLNDGIPLANILADLSAEDATRLSAGLTSLLNQGLFTPLSNSTALVGATCEILSLALGPLDLNLLGLSVELDDCAGGPVTLDITADAGGGLLGDLLCSLAGALQNPIQSLLRLRLLADLLSVLFA